MPRTVLVVGGSGFVGGHIVNRLAAAGDRVVVPTRRRDNARALFLLPTVNVVETDVGDPRSLPRLAEGADAVVNLVGILNEAGGATFSRAHVEVTRNAIAACKAAGVSRFVQMSALNAAADGPSDYQRSKAEAEAAVRDSGLDWTIFQPSVIFGPGDSFLNMFAKLARILPVIALPGAGVRFQPVYVGDVADCFVRALDLDVAIGRSYPLCGPRVYTLAELVRYVAETIDRPASGHRHAGRRRQAAGDGARVPARGPDEPRQPEIDVARQRLRLRFPGRVRPRADAAGGDRARLPGAGRDPGPLRRLPDAWRAVTGRHGGVAGATPRNLLTNPCRGRRRKLAPMAPIRAAAPRTVKIYRVGGSVRDELIGRAVADRDWVVVGATPETMLASGFRPVGRDFPVFLHPETREEYALARTERKHGQGYRGFEFFASPEVTLEDDLARRDLTINAMARGPDGSLIDPHGGARDLAAGVLRHVAPAFAEDPLRVLRVARFAARFGFVVAPETEALMRRLVASGELATLAAERVWQELARGLMEAHPSRLLSVLRDCGALRCLLPEVDALYGVPQPLAHHPEFDTGVHVALALDWAAASADRGATLPVRFAILAHDLGKARDPRRRVAAAPSATSSAACGWPIGCRRG